MFPIDWPALLVAGCMFFAGTGVIHFTRSQYNRRQARILIWLAVPLFTVCALYLYAALTWPAIETMRFLARWGFAMIGILSGIILHVTAYVQRGQRGRRS